MDISFLAVASLATFLASFILTNLNYGGGIWLFYVLSIIWGLAAGCLIGWLLATFKLGIFELSLGMAPMIYGLLNYFSSFIPSHDRLQALAGWNMKWLVTVQSAAGRTGLHVSVIVVILCLISMHIFLRYTTPGRAIYAMGSDKSVAIRTGFNIRNIYMTVFSIMGAMAAIAAVTSSGLGSGPGSSTEKIFRIYATIIIGGVSFRGGKGSVFGTLLGVLLVGLISQSLVYLSIPTVWWDAFLGLILITFTTYHIVGRQANK